MVMTFSIRNTLPLRLRADGNFFLSYSLVIRKFPRAFDFFFRTELAEGTFKTEQRSLHMYEVEKYHIYKHFLRFREDRVSAAHSCVGM